MDSAERFAFANSPPPAAMPRRMTSLSSDADAESLIYELGYWHIPFREVRFRGPTKEIQRLLSLVKFKPSQGLTQKTHVALTLEVYEVSEVLPLLSVTSVENFSRVGMGLLDAVILPARSTSETWCTISGPSVVYIASEDVSTSLIRPPEVGAGSS